MIFSQKNISGYKQNGFFIFFSFNPIFLPLLFSFMLFFTEAASSYNLNSLRTFNSHSLNIDSKHYYSVIPEIDINSLKQHNSILRNQDRTFNCKNFSLYYSIDEKLNYYNEITNKNLENLLWNVFGTVFLPFDRNQDQQRNNEGGRTLVKPFIKNIIIQNSFNFLICKSLLLSYNNSSNKEEHNKQIKIKGGILSEIHKTFFFISSSHLPQFHQKSILSHTVINC
jgi:hypothetical protein